MPVESIQFARSIWDDLHLDVIRAFSPMVVGRIIFHAIQAGKLGCRWNDVMKSGASRDIVVIVRGGFFRPSVVSEIVQPLGHHPVAYPADLLSPSPTEVRTIDDPIDGGQDDERGVGGSRIDEGRGERRPSFRPIAPFRTTNGMRWDESDRSPAAVFFRLMHGAKRRNVVLSTDALVRDNSEAGDHPIGDPRQAAPVSSGRQSSSSFRRTITMRDVSKRVMLKIRFIEVSEEENIPAVVEFGGGAAFDGTAVLLSDTCLRAMALNRSSR